MSTNKFKVIISGGGPVGLVAAHALYKAGIDFVLLEQRESITLDQGVCLALSPYNLRVMHQLGLLDQLLSVGGELLGSKAFLLNGYMYKDCADLGILKENHGLPVTAFNRSQLIQTFYDGLPESVRAQCLTNKKVADISSDAQGVSVTCADGSVYQGSMLLGADGVHSATRRGMRKLALKENPSADWDEENPFTTEYRCLWCSFPRASEPGVYTETTHKDQSIMYITGPDRGWMVAYEKLSEPTKERHKYGDKETEAFAERFAEFPVKDNLKVKDIYERRYNAAVTDLEEGIAKNWSYGRIVLTGDACHKFTPNAGLGLNNGIQDVVVLSNLIHSAVQAAPNNNTTVQDLSKVFQAYQKIRSERVERDYKKSADLTRLHAWANSIYYFFSRFVLSRPIIANLVVRFLTSPDIKSSFILDYIRASELPAGRVAWDYSLANPSPQRQL